MGCLYLKVKFLAWTWLCWFLSLVIFTGNYVRCLNECLNRNKTTTQPRTTHDPNCCSVFSGWVSNSTYESAEDPYLYFFNSVPCSSTLNIIFSLKVRAIPSHFVRFSSNSTLYRIGKTGHLKLKSVSFDKMVSFVMGHLDAKAMRLQQNLFCSRDRPLLFISQLNQFNVLCHFRDQDGDQHPRRKEGRGNLYLTLHCHHQNNFRMKMGSDVNYFNVSPVVQGKVTRQCP